MSDLAERFSGALHSASRSWRQIVDRRLKYLGLSQASWMTIAMAARAPAPLSQSELADKLGVEAATMVAMVDRLVKAGLIVRDASKKDRRIKHVVLTEAGISLYEKVKTEAAAVRVELLADSDRKKLLAATEFLEALLAKIDAKS
jgi:MarR family transcriptional regulator, transcriptional regulator for hemolysin